MDDVAVILSLFEFSILRYLFFTILSLDMWLLKMLYALSNMGFFLSGIRRMLTLGLNHTFCHKYVNPLANPSLLRSLPPILGGPLLGK